MYRRRVRSFLSWCAVQQQLAAVIKGNKYFKRIQSLLCQNHAYAPNLFKLLLQYDCSKKKVLRFLITLKRASTVTTTTSIVALARVVLFRRIERCRLSPTIVLLLYGRIVFPTAFSIFI